MQDSATPRQTTSPPGRAGEDAVQAILFFDGVCGLCSHAVDFILIRDTDGRICFAPMQGDTAKGILSKQEIENLSSMSFRSSSGKLTRQSSAAVRILWTLGGKWKLLGGLLWLVPKPIRDLGYWLIAKNRYRLFGKKEICRLPTPEEQGRILM